MNEEILELNFKKIHLHITGSVNASLVPYWINWSRRIYPDLEISTSVTKSAMSFVSIDALKSLTDGFSWVDTWESTYPREVHAGLEEYAEVLAIFPASINTVMQISSGFTSTPMQMALQLTKLPTIIAKTFPGQNKIINHKLHELLEMRNNFYLPQEVPAYSLARKNWSASTGFYYPHVLKKAQEIIDNED